MAMLFLASVGKQRLMFLFLMSLVTVDTFSGAQDGVSSTAEPCHAAVIPIPLNRFPSTNLTAISPVNGRKGYLVRSTESLSFRVETPCGTENGTSDEKCGKRLERVSKQSRRHQCHVAVNAGPFGPHGELIGGVVMRQRVSNDFSDGGDVGFGWTRRNEWVVGQVNASVAASLQLVEFVTGFEWLVFEGEAVDTPSNPTGAKRAPRTAIGVDADGNLMILVVDGCEKCLRNRGLTLKELANVFVAQGAYYGINLDGGSSSTLVVANMVQNRPTCLDIPVTCERPVATIFCLGAGKTRTRQDVVDDARYE